MIDFNKNNEIKRKSSLTGNVRAEDAGPNGAVKDARDQKPGGVTTAKANVPKKIDINRYRDPAGMSLQKMAMGLWYVEHKKNFVRLFIFILLAVSAVSWLYTFYHVIDYVAFGLKKDRLMLDGLVQPSLIGHDYLVQIGAKAIEFGPVGVISEAGDNTYDFLAPIRNPNKKYYAKFDYYFTSGGKKYGEASGFILPEETKYLVALAEQTETRPSESRLYVYNLAWSRVNSHVIPDWAQYRHDHLDIAINVIAFTPAAETILSEKLPLNDLKFTATNNTAYNYEEVDFDIFLYDNNGIIGVNKYIMHAFGSGQTQSVNMTWSGQFGRVDKVLVTPAIDITRDDIYLKFEGG
jgi:hypothetical protein